MSLRYQAVWIENSLSSFLRCPVGVPQGSNLGHLLFLVFHYNLPYSLSCQVDVYADESIMSVSMAINWLYVDDMEISMVKTKVGYYGNQILALQPCGGNPYGA